MNFLCSSGWFPRSRPADLFGGSTHTHTHTLWAGERSSECRALRVWWGFLAGSVWQLSHQFHFVFPNLKLKWSPKENGRPELSLETLLDCHPRQANSNFLLEPRASMGYIQTGPPSPCVLRPCLHTLPLHLTFSHLGTNRNRNEHKVKKAFEMKGHLLRAARTRLN